VPARARAVLSALCLGTDTSSCRRIGRGTRPTVVSGWAPHSPNLLQVGLAFLWSGLCFVGSPGPGAAQVLFPPVPLEVFSFETNAYAADDGHAGGLGVYAAQTEGKSPKTDGRGNHWVNTNHAQALVWGASPFPDLASQHGRISASADISGGLT